MGIQFEKLKEIQPTDPYRRKGNKNIFKVGLGVQYICQLLQQDIIKMTKISIDRAELNYFFFKFWLKKIHRFCTDCCMSPSQS